MAGAFHRFTLERLVRTAVRFKDDRGGNIAIIFGVSAVMIFTAMGAGLDLSRAYLSRQKLSQVARLSCQYASRPAIADTSTASYSGTNGGATYSSKVAAFIATTWQSQNVNLSQTNAAPFTYTQGGAATVTLAASVPTTFMSIAGFTAIPIGVSVKCYATLAGVQPPGIADSSSQFLAQESFEATPNGPVGGYTFYAPNGSTGTQATPTTYNASVGYTGANGQQWHITGYCLEQDHSGVIESSVYDGNYSVELDCDNGSGSAGNSAISTLVYAPAGTYELRYSYVSRVDYPSYDPTYICGSAAADTSWASSSQTSWGGSLASAYRTNQINVYFDLNPSTNAPPMHTTLDGNETLAGSNLIDMCVYSPAWVQRSVKITVTTPGYYWLSFAADGTSDSYGGQLDAILLCKISCNGTVQDNFPSAWASSNTLFNETFESPLYTQDPYTSSKHAKGGNLALSYGTTGTSSSGWPNQSASGWATAPYNEVNYWMQSTGMTGASGQQYISLQGWNGFSNSSDPINRSISRPFLLDPGYYNVSYNYVSMMDFSYDFIYGINCTAAPTFTNSYSGYGVKHGHDYGDAVTLWSQYLSTNFLNVFMANGQLVSTPSVNSTLGGAPTYANPDGTSTSSPKVPMDNGTNFATYNASAVNPVIDNCSYSSGFVWVPRSINITINKTGYYWLDFSAQGNPLTGTGAGPAIDNVKLTALGSPYSSAPASPVTIPVPSPQTGSNIYYTGFSIVADPFAP